MISLIQVLDHFSSSVQRKSSYLKSGPRSWLDSFYSWVRSTKCCAKSDSGQLLDKWERQECDPISGETPCEPCLDIDQHVTNATFDEYLQLWLNAYPDESCPAGGAAQFSNSLASSAVTNPSQDQQRSKTFYLMAYRTTLKQSKDFYESLRQSREIADILTQRLQAATGLKSARVRPYSYPDVFYEQYLTMWPDTAIQLSASLGAIFLVTYLFLGLDWKSALIVVGTIIMIIVNIMGLMFWWDISMNAVSLVNLVVVRVAPFYVCNVCKRFFFF